MKKILSTIISFAVCLSISGQQISQSNNRYRGNDMLEKKQVTLKDFDLNRKNGVWSLEDAEFSKATCKVEYTMETDTLSLLGHDEHIILSGSDFNLNELIILPKDDGCQASLTDVFVF